MTERDTALLEILIGTKEKRHLACSPDEAKRLLQQCVDYLPVHQQDSSIMRAIHRIGVIEQGTGKPLSEGDEYAFLAYFALVDKLLLITQPNKDAHP